MEKKSNQINDSKTSKNNKFKIYKKKKIFLSKKRIRPSNNSTNLNMPQNIKDKIQKNSGLKKVNWTEEEYDKFLEGIILYGKDWKRIKTMIKNKKKSQIKSLAKKFYTKLKLVKDENIGIDFTSDSINNIKDMINEIKKSNCNFIILNVLKYLSIKYNIFTKKKYDDNKLKDYLNENLLKNKNEAEEIQKIIGDKKFDVQNSNKNSENFNENTNLNKNHIINNINFINNYIIIDRNDFLYILLSSLLLLYKNIQMNNQSHN